MFQRQIISYHSFFLGMLCLCMLCESAVATVRKPDVIAEVRTALLHDDWRRGEQAISSIRKTRNGLNTELSGLLLELLRKEMARLEHSPMLLSKDQAYRDYFSTLVKILSVNTSERLDILLVNLPYWEETIFHVLVTQGGEDILPKLLLRLSHQPDQQQDLRSGILAITYTHIAQHKYSSQQIRTLKDIYLSFLFDAAFHPNDSLSVRSTIKMQAIIGLGVIGEQDVLPLLTPLLTDQYCKENTFYDPTTGLQTKSQGMQYCPVREEAKRVIGYLEKKEKLLLDDLLQGED